MNDDKWGRPYRFPDSYIEFLFFRVGLNVSYRVIEGVNEALSVCLTVVKDIHFTQIRRRMLAMVRKKMPEYVERIGEGVNDDTLTVVVDPLGLSITRKGSCIEAMWRREKRKFVKLHIAADKNTGKIVGFRVTSEKTGDMKKFVPMVKEVAKKRKVAKVYADAAYDSREELQPPPRARDRGVCHQGEEGGEHAGAWLSP
jgi:hypothetical protein